MNKVINIAVLVSLLAAAAILFGCGKNRQSPDLPSPDVMVSTAAVQDFTPDVGKYGTVAQCPVTKEKFKIAKGTAGVTYKGKAYYFCCPSCEKQFRENPEKYMNVN